MSDVRPADILATIDVDNTLGEGVLWNDETQTLWWTDIQNRRLFSLTWPGLVQTTYETPERLCSFGFVEGTEDQIIAAFETGFALFTPYTGDVDWLAKPPELTRGRRLNDGRVGPDGRFWAGSMIEDSKRGHALEETGFYCLDGDGSARLEAGGLQISNGLCWSPDGTRVYFADSPAGKIFSASYDRTRGTFGAREVFASIEGGGPDGAVTDADGHVWSAIWGGHRLTRLAPDGSVSLELDLPVLQPTCPVFGGEDLGVMFVTSASEDLDEAALEAWPASGSLLIISAPEDVTGLPAPRYRAPLAGLQTRG